MHGWRLVWLVLAVACADEPAPRATVPVGQPPLAPVTTGPTTLPAPPVEETVRVQVLDPGREPRRALRYRPVIGTEQTILLDTRMDLALRTNGHLVFEQAGESKGKLVVRVEQIASERITIALTVTSMEMPSYDPTDFGKPAVIKGQGGTIIINDRGKLLETRLPFLETNASAREWLQPADYLVRLPEEPVGPGARWQVHTTGERNGIAIQIVDTHELVELTTATVRTRSTSEQDSWPQHVSSLSDDPITVFEVSTFKSTGSGEVTVDLDRPMPLEVLSRFEFATDMTTRQPDGEQAVTMTMKATIHTTTEGNGGRSR